MNGIDALWVDRCLQRRRRGPLRGFANACRLCLLGDDACPIEAVRTLQPGLVVFDFDYPDAEGLRALLQVRREHAHIPVLMLVEPCYDSVLLWALRARVWDVLLKPIDAASLVQRMHWLRNAAQARVGSGSRANAMPLPALPVEARFSSAAGERTRKAGHFIETHLHERLSECAVARHCGLSRSEFSRAFHDEHGMTFRRYLLSARMRRAADMLRRTRAPITEIALCVGIHDLSHFASQFRVFAGCTPSAFRRDADALHGESNPDQCAQNLQSRAQIAERRAQPRA